MERSTPTTIIIVVIVAATMRTTTRMKRNLLVVVVEPGVVGLSTMKVLQARYQELLCPQRIEQDARKRGTVVIMKCELHHTISAQHLLPRLSQTNEVGAGRMQVVSPAIL